MMVGLSPKFRMWHPNLSWLACADLNFGHQDYESWWKSKNWGRESVWCAMAKIKCGWVACPFAHPYDDIDDTV